MGFSIWNDTNSCLSWDETTEWFNLMGIQSVPVIYDGIFDEGLTRSIYNAQRWNTMEGYVIRVAEEIKYSEFKKKVAKFVRKGHVQTAKHWMYGQPVEKNHLKEI